MPIIRASEVGEYVYCARAWWLRRVAGMQPAEQARRDKGMTLHWRHGQAVRYSRMLLVLAGALLLVALILLLVSARQ
jgi:CRISPR/Cas system-associated exonuclease Cas4 (RecB family)